MPKYDKLIRDKIPENISQSQKNFKVEQIYDQEVALDYLMDKLIEEAGEFRESPSMEEMADILEVIDELMQRFGFSFFEVVRAKELKRQKKGGFRENIILKQVSD